MKCRPHRKSRAVTGVKCVNLFFCQKINGFLAPLIFFHQMQSAQKPQYLCFARDNFGILYDVADAGMRAAGDDVNACVCHISQSCVVINDVGNSLSVQNRFADGVGRLKIYGMGNFSQKNQVICESQGFFGKFQNRFFLQFFHR